MKKKIELKQGSPEWLEFRKNKIGSSDAPTIMECSPWETPYQLWEEKMSLTKGSCNWGMERGTTLEPIARRKFEEMTGLYVVPATLLHPDVQYMMASLDGLSEDERSLVEIKCPGAEDHSMAQAGIVPEKYMPQLQHALEVAQLDMAYYFSFDGHNNVILKVYRDDKFIKEILKKEAQFYECMQSFVAPKFTQKDFIKRDDEVWMKTAQELLELDRLLERREMVREALIEMAEGRNCEGGGVRVTKVISKGRVDYTKIPELKIIELDKYRKAPSESWRVAEA